MYSRFCYHIKQDEQKRRATMHINRKPGEQVEVDWAGGSRHTGRVALPHKNIQLLGNKLLVEQK